MSVICYLGWLQLSRQSGSSSNLAPDEHLHGSLHHQSMNEWVNAASIVKRLDSVDWKSAYKNASQFTIQCICVFKLDI